MTDSSVILFLNVATFFWLGSWSFRAILDIARGVRKAILFVIPIHFLFSGVPLILDVVIGQPAYRNRPGFYVATRDELTTVIYCLYVAAVPLIWWWFGQDRTARSTSRSFKDDIGQQVLERLSRYRLLFILMLISPLIILPFSPNWRLYREYGAILKYPLLRSGYHDEIIALLAVLSLLASGLLLATTKRHLLVAIALLTPWFLLSVWLHGKRIIVALGLLLWLVVLWYRRYLRGGRIVVTVLLALIFMSVFSFQYQVTLREYTQNRLYENARIEYGRDDVIKLTIYAESSDGLEILEHRGQSILFYLTMFVPRSLWPEKPFPYAQYVTSAMFLVPPSLRSWSMTTSWLEEAIANFSWIGMLIGPMTIAVICRLGDRRHNVFVFALTVVVSALLLAVHLVAFLPLFASWILAVWFVRPHGSIKTSPEPV